MVAFTLQKQHQQFYAVNRILKGYTLSKLPTMSWPMKHVIWSTSFHPWSGILEVQ